MSKLKLADYIHIIDRMLEREGLAEVERDSVLNDPTNIEMISVKFQSKTHPSKVVKELDRRPVEAMYASLQESLRILGYIYEAGEAHHLTDGQTYAIEFLKSLGIQFNTPLNRLKKGVLEFIDPLSDTKWQISPTGYIRKLNNASAEVRRQKRFGSYYAVTPNWILVYSHFPPQWEHGKKYLDDDEYMDLAEIMSRKIGAARQKINKLS